MGAMSCGRIGCENIMCNTFVNGVGYICRECQTEFSESTPNQEYTENEILDMLSDFMGTYKGSAIQRYDVNGFFESYRVR